MVLFLFLFVLAGVLLFAVDEKRFKEILDFAEGLTSGEKSSSPVIRGTIYDRNFKQLAISLERVSLYARPRELKGPGEIAVNLAEILGVDEGELLENLQKDSQMVWLERDLSREEEQLIRDISPPGIYFYKEQARYYPAKESAAHLVGFSEDGRGLAGLEYRYNQLLNQRDIGQEEIPYIDLGGESSTGESGFDIVLTLDLKIQSHLRKLVEELGSYYQNSQVASLLIEPESGSLIASANFPSYDPNRFWDYKKNDLSTILFDPLVIPQDLRLFFRDIASLQAGLEKNSRVDRWVSPGEVGDLGSQFRLWERLGFSAPMQFDFFGKSHQGVFLNEEDIVSSQHRDCGTVPLISTPIHLLLAFSQLLNGGKEIFLHSLESILEQGGEKEFSYVPVLEGGVQKQLVSPLISGEAGRLLVSMGKTDSLGSVSLTGEDVAIKPVPGGHEYVRNEVLITALPPVNPELVLILVIKKPFLEPAGKEKKSLDLIRKISAILPAMAALQLVRSNFSGMLEVAERPDDNYQKGKRSKGQVSKSQDLIIEHHSPLMPDLQGKSLRKALRLLQDKEIRVEIQGTGRVVSQQPAPGTSLKKQDKIVLILARDN